MELRGGAIAGHTQMDWKEQENKKKQLTVKVCFMLN